MIMKTGIMIPNIETYSVGDRLLMMQQIWDSLEDLDTALTASGKGAQISY